jgi:hypothetical protein
MGPKVVNRLKSVGQYVLSTLIAMALMLTAARILGLMPDCCSEASS